MRSKRGLLEVLPLVYAGFFMLDFQGSAVGVGFGVDSVVGVGVHALFGKCWIRNVRLFGVWLGDPQGFFAVSISVRVSNSFGDLTRWFGVCSDRWRGMLSLSSTGNSEQLVNPLKTVVGSFPPKKLPLEKAIEWAVDFQLAHGLDVISDGEQRTDMISYFGSLPGLGVKPTGIYVESQIRAFEKPEGFSKLLDLQYVREYLKSKNREDVQVKVSITGPITLGFACACNGVKHYSGIRDTKLYYDFASALKPLTEAVAKTGCYVQIDEPSLSIRVMEAAQAVKIVNETLSGVPSSTYDEGKLVVHVCGSLNKPLFEDLMSLEAPVLSLAFSAPTVRANVETLSKLSLQGHRKKLGVGCVSVLAKRKEEVDSHDSVIQRLEAIREKIGDEQIVFVHPDCGMRGTCEDAVDPILERVVSSTEYLQKRQ